MKNLVKSSLVLVTILASASAFASLSQSHLTQNIECQGQSADVVGTTITVLGNPKDNTLTLTQNLSAGEDSIQEQVLQVTRVIPMFPVYSVEAKRDLRMVDGGLTTADLTIQTESFSVGGNGNSAKLVVKTYNPRTNAELSETFQLRCEISR